MNEDFLIKAAEQNVRLECIKIAAANKDLFGAAEVIEYATVLVDYINGKVKP